MTRLIGPGALRLLAKSDSGSSVVEVALVAPLLIALTIGSVEVGRYADYAIKITNAARAGVQYGAQNIAAASDTVKIQAAALGDAQSIAGLTATSQTSCTCADGSPDANCALLTCPTTNHRIVYVRVDTTGTMKSLFDISKIPGLPASLGSITVSRTAIMRVAE